MTSDVAVWCHNAGIHPPSWSHRFVPPLLPIHLNFLTFAFLFLLFIIQLFLRDSSRLGISEEIHYLRNSWKIPPLLSYHLSSFPHNISKMISYHLWPNGVARFLLLDEFWLHVEGSFLEKLTHNYLCFVYFRNIILIWQKMISWFAITEMNINVIHFLPCFSRAKTYIVWYPMLHLWQARARQFFILFIIHVILMKGRELYGNCSLVQHTLHNHNHKRSLNHQKVKVPLLK